MEHLTKCLMGWEMLDETFDDEMLDETFDKMLDETFDKMFDGMGNAQ